MCGNGLPRGWTPERGELKQFTLKPQKWGVEANRLVMHMGRDDGKLVYFHVAQQTFFRQPQYLTVVEIWTEEGHLWRHRHCREGPCETPFFETTVDIASMGDIYSSTVDATVRDWSDELRRWIDG